MAILQLRVFCACFFNSTQSLRFELAVAYARRMDDIAKVIALHLRARRWIGRVWS